MFRFFFNGKKPSILSLHSDYSFFFLYHIKPHPVDGSYWHRTLSRLCEFDVHGLICVGQTGDRLTTKQTEDDIWLKGEMTAITSDFIDGR